MEIKDHVAVATGIAGCLTGCIGIYRSYQTDRRSRLQPYFATVWAETSAWLIPHMRETSNWLDCLQRTVDENPYGMDAGSQRLEPLPLPSRYTSEYNFAAHDWKFDRHVYRLIHTYTAQVEQVAVRASQFNDFYDPASEQFALYALFGRGLTANVARMRGTSVEMAAQGEQERVDKALKIFAKYLSKSANVGDLKVNRRYNRDLNQKKRRVLTQVHHLLKTLDKIQRIADFYDRTLTSAMPTP